MSCSEEQDNNTMQTHCQGWDRDRISMSSVWFGTGPTMNSVHSTNMQLAKLACVYVCYFFFMDYKTKKKKIDKIYFKSQNIIICHLLYFIHSKIHSFPILTSLKSEECVII